MGCGAQLAGTVGVRGELISKGAYGSSLTLHWTRCAGRGAPWAGATDLKMACDATAVASVSPASCGWRCDIFMGYIYVAGEGGVGLEATLLLVNKHSGIYLPQVTRNDRGVAYMNQVSGSRVLLLYTSAYVPKGQPTLYTSTILGFYVTRARNAASNETPSAHYAGPCAAQVPAEHFVAYGALNSRTMLCVRPAPEAPPLVDEMVTFRRKPQPAYWACPPAQPSDEGPLLEGAHAQACLRWLLGG